MSTYEGKAPTIDTSSAETLERPAPKVKEPPTIAEVLEWARYGGRGIVLKDWAKSPMRSVFGRIIFPTCARSTKISDTSALVKEAINLFYPHIKLEEVFKHACYVTVKSEGTRLNKILILEGNLQLRENDPMFRKGVPSSMIFPSYSEAKRSAKPTIFLEVDNVLVQGS